MVTALQLLHQLILHSFLCVRALIFCRFCSSNHILVVTIATFECSIVRYKGLIDCY